MSEQPQEPVLNTYRISLMRGAAIMDSRLWTSGYVHSTNIHDVMAVADDLIKKPESWSKWRRVQDGWWIKNKILYELYVSVQIVDIGDTDGLTSVINAESQEWLRS